MYEKHFGFHRQPFQAAAPAEAYVVSECLAAIQPRLLRCLRSGLGLALVTGLSGCGKTSLLRYLQRTLENDGRAILVSGATLDSQHVLRQVLMHAALRQAGGAAQAAELKEPLTTWRVLEQLHQSMDFWGPVVLLLDDLHLVQVPVLNELRGLSEESSQGRRLLRVVGTAPASFELECSRPDYEYFRSGIRCSEFLQPLSMDESLELLNRHLRCCGGDAAEAFSADSVRLLLQACGGLPASLAVLADECLAVAAERNQRVVDTEMVECALQRLRHLSHQWNLGVLEDGWQEDEGVSDTAGNGAAADHSVVEIVGLTDDVAGVTSTAASDTAESAEVMNPESEMEFARTATGYSVEVGYSGDDDVDRTVAETSEFSAEEQTAAAAATAEPPSAVEVYGCSPDSAVEASGAEHAAARTETPHSAALPKHPQQRSGFHGLQDAQRVATSDDAISEMLRGSAGSEHSGWFSVEGSPSHRAAPQHDPPSAKNPINSNSSDGFSPEMLSIVPLRGKPTAVAESAADRASEDCAAPAEVFGKAEERDERLTHLFTRLRRLQEMSRRSS